MNFLGIVIDFGKYFNEAYLTQSAQPFNEHQVTGIVPVVKQMDIVKLSKVLYV